MTLETMPDLPPRSDTPMLRLMNNPRRVLDTGLAILVWIAVIGVVLWGVAHVAAPWSCLHSARFSPTR